jgi:hypothetical protein
VTCTAGKRACNTMRGYEERDMRRGKGGGVGLNFLGAGHAWCEIPTPRLGDANGENS